MAIKKNTPLTCGCCGEFFRTWEGYVDQDQDAGFGICESCQAWILEKNKAEAQKLIDCLKSGLGEENRLKFESYDWEVQAGLAVQALEEGTITLEFGSRS